MVGGRGDYNFELKGKLQESYIVLCIQIHQLFAFSSYIHSLFSKYIYAYILLNLLRVSW